MAGEIPRFYSKGRLGISLSEEQWKMIDAIKARKKGKLISSTIHHGKKAWINDFSKLLKEVLQEDDRS